jgi:hypothetical protein
MLRYSHETPTPVRAPRLHLQPAFAAAIPVRVATVEQTAHAAERQIPGRIEAITPLSCARAHRRRDRQNPLPRRAVREKRRRAV